MPSIVLYLIKCSIGLAIVWLFYQLLLRRLTFYSMNRWYLMGYAVLSFLLPLIHIALPAEEKMTRNMQVIRYIPVITAAPSGSATAPGVAYTGWDMLLAILALGVVLLLVRLLIRYLSLRRIQKGAVLIGDSHVTIYHVNELIIPFSFGKAIYINPRLHSEKECEEIILHEYVHVRQRHTVDILIGEVLCILSWFNPFSWLIRHSIRQNLEFIADRQVLASGLDKKAYQYHLLKAVGESRYGLANNFNFSSLKKRIIMMNKSRSAKLHLLKFLFIVPLLGVLLVAFRDRVDIHLSALHKERLLPPAENMASVSSVRIDTSRPMKDTAHGKSNFVTLSLSKDSLNIEPMYVLDEVETSLAEMKHFDPVNISFMDIQKSEKVTGDFGPRAKGGVVLVFTKAYAPNRKNEILLKDGRKVKLAVPTPPPPTPATPGEKPMKRDTLTHAQLTKPVELSFESVKVGDDIYSGQLTSSGNPDTTSPDPHSLGVDKFLKEALIILDGKPCAYEDLKLDPDAIKSVNIIKDKSGVAKYGPKAENGVVIITTKKAGDHSAQTLSTKGKDGASPMKLENLQINFVSEQR